LHLDKYNKGYKIMEDRMACSCSMYEEKWFWLMNLKRKSH